MTSEAWRTFSEELDHALALAPEERAVWLVELERAEPENAQRIRALLDSAAAIDAEGFLAERAQLAEPPSGLLGARVGPWVVESEIGRGGMSSVWRARRSDGRYEGTAAIKFVSFAALGREGEARFRREGLLLGRLAHPNIAHLLDAGVYGETRQPYLVLEFVDGVAIDEHCERSRLGARERIALFQQVLEAVSHAHGHLVVHRDLKASNILVTRDGAVKLLDFGIAKLLEDDAALTRSGVSALTPQYAAPEQVLGEPITTRTDLYALGLVLYRLFTGRHARALDGGGLAELQRAVLGADPPLPSACAPGIPGVREALPGDLDNIVMKALRKPPEERYATAAAFAEDLTRYLRYEPVAARPTTLSYRAAKFVRRNRGGVASAALVTLALLGTTAFAVTQMLEARRQRDAAELEAARARAQAAFSDQLLMQTADLGERLTPALLLARSVEFVEARFADEPEFAVGLLIHLSGRYMNRGDSEKELATLVKAERLAEKARSPALLARVECNTVETELALSRRGEARRRLRRGIEALARVEEPSVQLRYECAGADAILRQADGDTTGAIAAATHGARLLEDAGETGTLAYQSATSMLTALHRMRLELREALAWNQRGLGAMERAGFGRSENAVLALHSRGQILAASGEWKSALALTRDVLARLRAQDPSAEGHPRVLTTYALCLSEVGDWREATAAFARADERARATGSDSVLVQIRIAQAEQLAAQGETAEARGRLEEAEGIVARDQVRHAAAAAQLRVARAALELAAGDFQKAEDALAPLLTDSAAPDGQHYASARAALRVASALALARGDPAEAQSRAERALAIARAVALEPDRSADVGEAWLALARAQLASGERAAARQSAARAASPLRAGRGEGHPRTREALALAR